MLGTVTSAPSQSHERRVFLCFLLYRKRLSGRETVTHKDCSALLRAGMRAQKCSAFDPAFTPCSVCTEGLNCSASRSETLQPCLAVCWCDPPAPPHQPLPSPWSFSCALGQELLVWHLPTHLLDAQPSTGCWAGHGQQCNSTETELFYSSGSQVETSALSSLSFVLALIAASHSSLLLPSVCQCVPLPSTTYLPLHCLLCSRVQGFRASCPNPETGCSNSSAASSSERKKFQYFNICSHPNLGRKTEIRDYVDRKFTSLKRKKERKKRKPICEHQCILCHLKWNILHYWNQS